MRKHLFCAAALALVVGTTTAAATSAAAQAVDDAAPAPPAGAAPSFVPPPHDDGGYRTPNRALTPDETTWHLRVALNVAALGCRGPDEAATVAAYNAVLHNEGEPLAAAMAGTENGFKARHGVAWQARYDDDMTRLYNFFAQPPAQAGFCAAAQDVLHESQAIAPADFAAFAATALPRLEAPFVAFFAAYDAYRTSLAAWRARQASVVIATAAAAPMGLTVARTEPVPAPAAMVAPTPAALATPTPAALAIPTPASDQPWMIGPQP